MVWEKKLSYMSFLQCPGTEGQRVILQKYGDFGIAVPQGKKC